MGVFAEYYAAAFLLLKGYKILSMRYKTKVGEVDIVAKRGRGMVFIEVKYRKSMDESLSAVSIKSQSRIRRAAEHYILVHGCESDNLLNEIRFDVIAIASNFLIKHIKNTF